MSGCFLACFVILLIGLIQCPRYSKTPEKENFSGVAPSSLSRFFMVTRTGIEPMLPP